MVWGLVSGFSALKNRSHGIILFLIKFILEAKHVGIILLSFVILVLLVCVVHSWQN